jgi:hypothetical protein
MTEQAQQFQFMWFPMQRNRQLQCERLYHAVLKYKKEVRGKDGELTAVDLTDLYTLILDINLKGEEPLPAFAAQLAIEAAMQELK